MKIHFLFVFYLTLANGAFEFRKPDTLNVWRIASSAGSAHQLWYEPPKGQKWFICLTPKIACSEWLRFIYTQLLPEELRPLSRSPVPEDKYIYNDHNFPAYHLFKRSRITVDAETQKMHAIDDDSSYFKVMVARHPWDRLVSGYRAKVERICLHKPQCMTKLFNITFMPSVGSYLDFDEFVEALTQQDHMLEAHFRPLTLTCGLGAFNYDEVVDLRDTHEMDAVSHKLGFETNFSTRSNGPYVHRATSTVHSVLNCTGQTVRLAESIYGADAFFLGVSFLDAYHSCTHYGVSSMPSKQSN